MELREKSWKEFQEAGLLWWINRLLHTFGWAIVLEFDAVGITRCYPARVQARGFERSDEEAGFVRLTHWMEKHSEELRSEIEESEKDHESR